MAVARDNGIVDIPSNHSVDQTVEKLKSILAAKDVTLFALVDHSGEAEKAGMKMRPTKLLIFGSPKGGTPVMQSAQTAGIDLPLKALVWQDEAGTAWLSYNAPAWIAETTTPGFTSPYGTPPPASMLRSDVPPPADEMRPVMLSPSSLK